MSIAAVEVTVAADVLFVALTLLAIGLFFALKVHRPQRILGPARLGGERPALPVLLLFILGAVTWFGSATAYFGLLQARHLSSGSDQVMGVEDLTSGQMAFMASVPPLLGLGVFALGYALFYRAGARTLGFAPAQLGRGVAQGLVGFLIVWPLVWWASYLTELIYVAVDFEHPEAHELLVSLRNSSSRWQEALIILAATTIVPVFEEFLFRGHLQSLMRRALLPLKPWTPPPAAALPAPVPPASWVQEPEVAPVAAPAMPAPPPLATAAPPVLAYAAPDLSAPADSPVRAWLAVLCIALVFALFHPLWTAPPIFVLAVGLGYAYERTGNLWTPIVMHALFNSLSTAQYLLMKP